MQMKTIYVWLGALVALIMLFIHPMLTLLAGILAAIVWHGLRTSQRSKQAELAASAVCSCYECGWSAMREVTPRTCEHCGSRFIRYEVPAMQLTNHPPANVRPSDSSTTCLPVKFPR
jgi:hypothetical protein